MADQLDSFLSELVEQYVPRLRQGLMTQATEEQKRLVGPLLDVFEQQMGGLADEMRSGARSLTEARENEVEKFLRMSAGPELVRSGTTVSEDLSTREAKLTQGGILNLIKKIIDELFDILPISKPKWFDKILDLINELLGEMAGVGDFALSQSFSRRNQEYLKEKRQLELLRQVKQGGPETSGGIESTTVADLRERPGPEEGDESES